MQYKRSILQRIGYQLLVFVALLSSCVQPAEKKREAASAIISPNDQGLQNDTVYKSVNLVLVRLTAHTYQHISFLNTHDFGKVDCNGMLVINDHEAIIFDSPANDTSAAELISFIKNKSGATIKAIVPTHFHADCVGGIARFLKDSVPCYASFKTIGLLQQQGNKYASRMKGFSDRMEMQIGDKKVEALFLGEGHTKDNIVGYFPEDSVLFGGCLIKASGANKGNLEDANISEWPSTVNKLKQKFPQAKIVIPGHGKTGGKELLDYTI
ncbi:MAG: subclass B1 metallo-beta-lactamase, partial [Chitinophagaceae bacterium]